MFIGCNKNIMGKKNSFSSVSNAWDSVFFSVILFSSWLQWLQRVFIRMKTLWLFAHNKGGSEWVTPQENINNSFPFFFFFAFPLWTQLKCHRRFIGTVVYTLAEWAC